MDIIERLESCLNAPAGSTTEEEAEKAIRSAIRHIKALRAALKIANDSGAFCNLDDPESIYNLLETDEECG